ncbi:hypothetical protein TSOC_005088 [Tetrabaena socialis]|uniref:50S ribosomal protein L13, chloroplastic n=1 Tax=Tetrabaena socialis TaxID=47790 RepID=A0A2J8A792_9CHLO|nr:hypothetical protein TSOC_005088 [Tetrabaena socialis]|eukprot:PNH08391.1 hypothetical protein TSOC_005088 [Tetrabaena socialis]
MTLTGKLGGQTAFTTERRGAIRTAFQGSRVASRVAPVVRSRTVSSVVCQAAAAEAPTFKGDLLNKSYYPTSADAAAVNKSWYVIDAEGQTLGRLATLAATYIR